MGLLRFEVVSEIIITLAWVWAVNVVAAITDLAIDFVFTITNCVSAFGLASDL